MNANFEQNDDHGKSRKDHGKVMGGGGGGKLQSLWEPCYNHNVMYKVWPY